MSDSLQIENGMIIEKITSENMYEYDRLIPPDVLENSVDREYHKGVALHREEGGEPLCVLMCATTGAGWDGNVKALVIEWIYVAEAEAFNILLEKVKEEAAKEDVVRLRVEIPVDDTEKKQLLLANGFEMHNRESLILETSVNEIADIKQFKGVIKGDVVPIDELFTREFRRAITNFIFHGARGLLEDAETLPMAWFDPELSCCFRTGEKITGMFLVKRTVSGILIPVLMFAFEPDAGVKLMMLLRYFVQTAEDIMPGDTRVLLCRFNENVRVLTDKLLPGKKGAEVLYFERDI